MRTLVGLCLVAVLVFGSSWSLGRPEKQPDKRPAKTADSGKAEAKLSLAQKLNKQIDFSGWDDPKTTLIEGLDQLAKIHHVTFDINDKAFASEIDGRVVEDAKGAARNKPELGNVGKYEIANPTPVPPMKAPLKAVLTRILRRIPNPSGATYLIRKDAIEITTNRHVQAEINPPGNIVLGPLDDEKADAAPVTVETFPLVSASFRKKPLAEALETLSEDNDVNIVLDPSVSEKQSQAPVSLRVNNLPADTAVLLMSRMADLHCVQIDNALFVSTTKKASSLKKLHALRRGKKIMEAEDEALLKEEEDATDQIGKKKENESSKAPPKPKKK